MDGQKVFSICEIEFAACIKLQQICFLKYPSM